MEKQCEVGKAGDVMALPFPEEPKHEKWYQCGNILKLVFLFSLLNSGRFPLGALA